MSFVQTFGVFALRCTSPEGWRSQICRVTFSHVLRDCFHKRCCKGVGVPGEFGFPQEQNLLPDVVAYSAGISAREKGGVWEQAGFPARCQEGLGRP